MNENEHRDSENPYAAPVMADASMATSSQYIHRPSGVWVRQIRIVAILMAVQGVLEFLFGLYFVGMGFFFPRLMAIQQQQNQMPQAEIEMVTNIMFIVFMVGGTIVILLGILRFIAGILGFNFRGRGLGITSHFLGLLSIFSFYCVITALPLCIYGSIVYFNREVTMAFNMRREGQSVNEILSQFS